MCAVHIYRGIPSDEHPGGVARTWAHTQLQAKAKKKGFGASRPGEVSYGKVSWERLVRGLFREA